MKLFEVFDSVNAPEELRRMFAEAEVLKLSASRHSGSVTVHIESDRLLSYGYLQQLAKVLNQQFFSGMDKTAVIAEHYRLSSQYTPASIWEHYNESVRDELGAKSRLYTGFLQRAEIFVTGEEMHIKTEDTFINRHIGEEVKSCIEELFLSRFEVPLRVINEFEVAETVEEEAPIRPAYEFYSKDKLRSMGVMPAAKEEDYASAEDGAAEGANAAKTNTAEGAQNGAAVKAGAEAKEKTADD